MKLLTWRIIFLWALSGQKYQPLGHSDLCSLLDHTHSAQMWGSRLDQSFCIGNHSPVCPTHGFPVWSISCAFLLCLSLLEVQTCLSMRLFLGSIKPPALRSCCSQCSVSADLQGKGIPVFGLYGLGSGAGQLWGVQPLGWVLCAFSQVMLFLCSIDLSLLLLSIPLVQRVGDKQLWVSLRDAGRGYGTGVAALAWQFGAEHLIQRLLLALKCAH